jgi:hypothetical protein
MDGWVYIRGAKHNGEKTPEIVRKSCNRLGCTDFGVLGNNTNA